MILLFEFLHIEVIMKYTNIDNKTNDYICVNSTFTVNEDADFIAVVQEALIATLEKKQMLTKAQSTKCIEAIRTDSKIC